MATVIVDSNHPTLRPNTHLSMKWKASNSPSGPLFDIDSRLSNATDLRTPCGHVFCKGIHMTIVADHLDNTGFKAIAMSSLLESMYFINQEKEHPFKWTSRLQCCHYLYMGLFALCLFLWLYSICVLFVMTVLQSCPVLCYFCEVWILPGQFVTLYINCKPKPWMLLPSDLHCKWQIVGLVKTVVTRWNGLVCRVQLTIFQNWVRWWLGADKATTHYLNRCWPSSMTHTCGTWGKWVKSTSNNQIYQGWRWIPKAGI